MKSASLDDFDAKFATDPDPWSTFSARDEAIKRRAVLHALGAGPVGRVLELGCGNGSNSVALAGRALRLDATDGADAAVLLTRAALAHAPRATARKSPLPTHLPPASCDAAILAEILYYLTARVMAETAREVAGALRRGGVLVLAHHRVDFHDFAQPSHGLHRRFIQETRAPWRRRVVAQTDRWVVETYRRLG